MGREDKNTGETYYPKLYEACEYMIQNKEEFKSFDIYKYIDENCSKLSFHNRFLFQFRFLIGDTKNTNDEETNPKGTEIVPKIDINSLNTKTLAKMLAIIDHFINKSEDSSRTRINYQVLKVNVDKALTMMDYLVKKIIHCQVHELSEWREGLQKIGIKYLPEEKEYFKILEKIYDCKRKFVLSGGSLVASEIRDYDSYCNQIRYLWDVIWDKQDSEESFFSDFPKYKNLEIHYDAWMFVDLCSRTILQYVIQGIIKNKKNKNKLQSIKGLNNSIIGMINIQLLERNEYEYKVKLSEKAADNLFWYYSYFFIRDKFLQDIKILKDITNNYDQNEVIVTEGSLIHFDIKKNKKSWEEIQDLFEQGYQFKKKCNLKTFKKNVANCLLLIKKLNMMEMEGQIPYTPIRLKALYREFYLEKPRTDKRNTGMTIVNHFLKSDELKTSDYYFIKEILNKGFFKEYGLLKEYYAKNELQENLYYLVCLCLAKLNPNEIVKAFIQVTTDLSIEIHKLQNECNRYVKNHEEFYTDIGEFDLPIDCNKMTNEESKKIYLLLEKLFGIGN